MRITPVGRGSANSGPTKPCEFTLIGGAPTRGYSPGTKTKVPVAISKRSAGARNKYTQSRSATSAVPKNRKTRIALKRTVLIGPNDLVFEVRALIALLVQKYGLAQSPSRGP